MKKPLSLLLAVVLLLALAVPAYAAPANKVETKSGVVVMHAEDWKEAFPLQYETWLQNGENDEIVDYLEQYPYLRTLYEGYGFAIDYGSARGHFYDVQDIEATGRPHPLANCWTCKTPDFTNMVNEEGIEAYKKEWTEVQAQITESISCFTCHANTPGEITVTHTYWIDAVGEDFDRIAGANLACGQCHNEYYFAPDTKATSIAHTSLESMAPEAMLAFFNDGSNFPTGEPFTDWTNPRTGVQMIKVQHPEFETYLGAGSQHAALFTCADCHMAKQTAEDGTVYHSHYLTSPLQNEELIATTCSLCHNGSVEKELPELVASIQAATEERTNAIGFQLQDLTEKLAELVANGATDEQLSEARSLARDAQFYWDFVFVENSEGAHNSTLTNDCLDRAEALCAEALKALDSLSA